MIAALLRDMYTNFIYRRINLRRVGERCSYKAVSSSFMFGENITLGDDVNIGPGAWIDGAGGVDIGTGCIFGPKVAVFSRTHNFDKAPQALPFDHVQHVAPVCIGRYVWIGYRAIILPGVTIGELRTFLRAL
jgi:acetyltransferase-like isoleucine patch superfamily enzyme